MTQRRPLLPILGRYIPDEVIWGSTHHGLVRAYDDSGRRYLVSILPHYEHRLPNVLAESRRYQGSGFARLVEATRDRENRDVVVEDEPPGHPSYDLPPCSPSSARALAIQLGRIILRAGPGIRGVRPELVYVHHGVGSNSDGGGVEHARVTIALRYMVMAANNNPTLTGGLPLFPVHAMSAEEARGTKPLTRTHDSYVLAAMLRFWLTVSPLVATTEGPMQVLLRIIENEHYFRYDGPLHDVIDAGLAGESLAQLLERLERADLTAADAEHATRSSLIAEIVANPDDDGPRFVLADHLLERDDPRGELIQLQCRGRPVDALLEEHGAKWSAYLHDHVSEAFFERGFVAAVRGANRQDLDRRRDQLLAFGPMPRMW